MNTPISPSRLKTYHNCSWQYYANYLKRIPQPKQRATSIGTAVHSLLELFAEPKRWGLAQKVLRHGLYSSPSLSRLIETILKKEELYPLSESESDVMTSMVLNALSYDWEGKERGEPAAIFIEKSYLLNKNEAGKNYTSRGFIDRLFIYDDFAIVRDYKSSKQTYQGKDKEENLQAALYTLAVKDMFPEIKRVIVEFLFLRFDLNKDSEHEYGFWRGAEKKTPTHNGGGRILLELSDDELGGIEYVLTEEQREINSFSLESAQKNFAADSPMPTDGSFAGPLSCGFAGYSGQLKKDGTKMFACPYKFAMDYWEEEVNGKAIRSEFFPFEGGVKKRYEGCPKWNQNGGSRANQNGTNQYGGSRAKSSGPRKMGFF